VVLSLDVLAGRFAGWSYLYPEAGERARILLRRAASLQQTPLMDYYVYSSKHISSNAIAVLTAYEMSDDLKISDAADNQPLQRDRCARVRIRLAHQTPQIGDRLAHPGCPLYVTPAYEVSLLRPDQFSRLTTADASRPQPTPLAVAPESMTNDRSGRPDVGDKAVNLAS
jgi:hypothetical protein